MENKREGENRFFSERIAAQAFFATLCFIVSLVSGSCTKHSPDSGDSEESLQVFPSDNPWNLDISSAPVHPRSTVFIRSIGEDAELHPDFGTVWNGAPIGIPFVIVPGDQPLVPIRFTAYGNESDPGPYPIPDDAPIEGGENADGDRHVIVVDAKNRMLYELYRAFKTPSGWEAESGAKWDLTSNSVRPKYWTSADAAGLPIFPGLVRYAQVTAGNIRHALRVTVPHSMRGFIFPARHFASSSEDPDLPPMGLRLRLKANVDISGFSASNQVILRALQRYGMFVADNGAPWYISGAPDSRWGDDELHELHRIHGHDFEAIESGEIEK